MTAVGTDTVQTPRIDAVPKVTGQAVYTEDLPLPPGTLYGAILRSPYAHARLVSIDAQRAERLPGVHAVVTREHLGNLNPFLDPASYGAEGEGAAPLIALEKVRYEGEPVAAVAAETPALAQQALECIEVEYEDLPVIFDTREALQPDAPVIHDQRPGNLVGRFDFGWGDIEQGFREADHIFEDTYVFQSVFHHPMENLGGCIAEVRGDTLELTAPIQHPFRSRDEIAAMFGFDRKQVRVRFPYVGGGFCSKELKTEHLIAILLAIRSGRAVTLRPSAEESFRSDCRHAVVYHVKTGVKADGTLVAQDIDLLFDKGAYAHGNGMNVPRRGSSLAWGPYRVPHLRVVGRSYFTNKVPAGSFRSLGRAQTTWGYESHYDTIARQLGIDPVAFRLHNFLQRGERLVDTVGPFDTDMDDLVRHAMAALEWNGRSQRVGPQADAVYTGTTPVRGRGIAATFRHGYSGTSVSDVEVTADNRGIVRILHAGAEIGQGLYTMLARVASETLGIPESQIEVTHPNTDLPYSDGIGSSRDTVSMGMATQRACEDLKQQLVEVAAKAIGGRPEEWQLAGGQLWHHGERPYPIGSIISTLAHSFVVKGKGHYSTPRANNVWQGVVPHWELSVGAAEVEVDPETGDVTLLQYAIAADVGTAVHPVACKSQLDGGSIMGLGDAMYEEMVYGDGQLLNGDSFQYRLPLLHDLPPHFMSIMVENHDGPGPLGSKGMSQTAVSPIAPAIANAIYDAVGVRIKELPITPEKILRGLGKLA
jgi:CO/xanthine dehydrogenase Mo-binding subunit